VTSDKIELSKRANKLEDKLLQEEYLSLAAYSIALGHFDKATDFFYKHISQDGYDLGALPFNISRLLEVSFQSGRTEKLMKYWQSHLTEKELDLVYDRLEKIRKEHLLAYSPSISPQDTFSRLYKNYFHYQSHLSSQEQLRLAHEYERKKDSLNAVIHYLYYSFAKFREKSLE
jgi:hypothetical protein